MKGNMMGKFWLSMEDNMVGLDGSSLKSQSTTLLSYSFQ